MYKQGINHAPDGVNFLISSPFSWIDKICRLLKEAEGSKVSLAVRLPTWEVNPYITQDHPWVVDKYKRSPRAAERDIGANPPQIDSTRYDKEAIIRLFSGRQHHHTLTVNTDSKRRYGSVKPAFERNSWPATVLTLDAGYSNNAFAFTLGSPSYNNEDNIPSLQVFTVGEVVPQAGYVIDFPLMYKHVIETLVASCNVRFVVADRWNSIMLLQSISAKYKRVVAFQHSLKLKDFSAFDEDLVHTGRLTLPAMEIDSDLAESIVDYKKGFRNKPAAHLYLQFMTVRELGGTITKGEGYTDDIYRSLVLQGAVARLPKVVEKLRKMPTEQRAGISTRATLLTASRSLAGSLFRQ